MTFNEFEKVVSKERLGRYLMATQSNQQKAMALYRLNINLSHSAYSLIGLLEIALRNAIHNHYSAQYGSSSWLIQACEPGGWLTQPHAEETRKVIAKASQSLRAKGQLTPAKLLAELNFGVWRYLFNKHQYQYGDRTLHKIFPNYVLPIYVGPQPYGAEDEAQVQLYKWLDQINRIRNRVAHYEPLCFDKNQAKADSHYITSIYNLMLKFLDMMAIDRSILHGIDDMPKSIKKLDAFIAKL